MESLGRYRLQRRIGSGAFSTVWLGFDADLDIDVAIKVLADNWVDHSDISQRFLDEARLLRRVADRQIVRVHDIGWDGGRPYFVMDYVGGGTLAELTDLPLRAERALALTSEVARAIEVLHEHGVIHRDVKPSNVLLTDTPVSRVVIADLGMAKRLAESSGVTVQAGTPSFMAPEQAHGQSGLDVRTDVYGVAAVGYLLLTGARPFPDAQSVVDVAVRSAAASPLPVVDRLRDAPVGLDQTGLDDLLRTALAYSPGDRPATAAALADRLDALLDQARATEIDDQTLVRLRTVPPPRRSARLGVAALVLLVVAAVTWVGLSLALG